MNRRAMLLMVTAVGLFGAGGYLVSGNDDGPTPAAARAVPVPATAVVTVKAALPPGHLIRPDDVTSLAWPAETLPAAAIVDGTPAATKLAGSVTRRAFAAGEMIVAGSVITPGERGFLAAIVAPGKRAVAVSVDAASAAGGLIWPGDRVDVILTQEITGDQVQPVRKVVSETLLVDTRVLSSDQRLGNATEAAGIADVARPVAPQVPTTVTLEVTQADAERIAVAAALGKLSLALRASLPGPGPEADGTATWAGGVSRALRSVPGPKSTPAAVAAAPATPATERTTRIFRGAAAGA